RWINDSKATNVGSTEAALNGLQLDGTLYLLLGRRRQVRRWINDSKATNVGSTEAALNGLQLDGTLYLLLGR
ncbi:hypothetical protein CQA70_29800, partial [Klebsiella pneumoniae]